jgi:GDP/UDP-N,N'-diacetylbacillosamine 2-epimerase (hydrolysing)
MLRLMREDPGMETVLVAFGSHADRRLGHTLDEILASGFEPAHVLPNALREDDPEGIASAMGCTMEQFAAHWRKHRPDLIVALGDRYEMFAAVAAALPFGLPVVHLHGGEATKGAIDNALRHSITHMAAVHCCGTSVYADRVRQLTGSGRHVHNTGALSLDSLRTMSFLGTEALKERFGIDLRQPTILVTFHPETRGKHDEEAQWAGLAAALEELAGRYQVLVTMPNADTHGLRLRERWKRFIDRHPGMHGVDSMGAQGYLSAMKHCAFMLGNSSSGYAEASFFPKPVIDLGDRQTGRIVTPNIHRCTFERDAILAAVARIEAHGAPRFDSPYGDGHAATRILDAMRSFMRTDDGE